MDRKVTNGGDAAVRDAGAGSGWRGLCLLLLLLAGAAVHAGESAVRVGVLQFGTVNWELDVMRHHGLAAREGVRLEVVPMAGKMASAVALQSGAVDVIVSDWTWVARQRAAGKRYVFAPYSMAVGGLLVRSDAAGDGLRGLAGKRVGVAGGPADKSWLLLRAYAQQTLGKDLRELVEPVFGAPPLLNQLALRGELDGAITFWHYGARLQTAGFKPLVEMPEVLRALGVEAPLPLIGWVFDEAWAAQNRDAVAAFLRASYAAKRRLDESDAEWERIRPLTKAEDDATLIALRDAFRAGIPQRFGAAEIAAARQVYGLLARYDTELRKEEAAALQTAFWSGFQVPAWPR